MPRMSLFRPLAIGATLALSCAFAFGCSSDTGAGDEVDTDESELSTVLSANTITSATRFRSFSTAGGGFGQAGRSMKFLVDARVPTRRTVHFINSSFTVSGSTPDYAKYHYLFARRQLSIPDSNESFNQNTYFSNEKRFYAGTIQTYFQGDSKDPIYAIQLYPDDVANEDAILILMETLKSAFKIRGAKVAFVATGQQQTTARVDAKLRALGYELSSVDKMLGSVKILPMNPGEGWGYLRIFPKDFGDLRPTDIPVFDELPLDLAVVAGTITKTVQDATSHVNLKSKERGTPNLVMRDASAQNPALAPFADKPIHFVVRKDGFTIEPSTDAEVKKKLADRLGKPWIPLPVVSETRVVSYDTMCPGAVKACLDLVPRYGGKAVGLGFLAHKTVLGRASQAGTKSALAGYDLTPKGVAVPVQMYRDFVDDPANAALKAKIRELWALERGGAPSPNERRTLVTSVQALFMKARLAPERLAQVRDAIAAAAPNDKKLKVRSSSNAEDVPNFDGAGLYDSFSADLSVASTNAKECAVVFDPTDPTKGKVKPKTLECAIKGVYASLWNVRALSERSFARLEHESSAMGLAVVPQYDNESDVSANAVVVTRAVNGDNLLAYTLATQAGNNLVTNPDPGTLAETTFASFGSVNRPPRFTTMRFAIPEAGAPARTTPVLEEAKMLELVEITKAVEIAYCSASPDYYPGDCRNVWLDDDKPKSLDLEAKILANGHLVIKQSREFHGR